MGHGNDDQCRLDSSAHFLLNFLILEATMAPPMLSPPVEQDSLCQANMAPERISEMTHRCWTYSQR